ncbi:hypothetical protein F4777DRAFT_566017 [Nemania sp. FL0916]|nr:hypothetical protein F4777DRAFT_566017 [Nemania sp. FL0916]
MTAGKKPQKGDKVSWKWGGGAPGGTVAETKESGDLAIKSKRGNTIKKNASRDNPAVHVGRSGNDVVKRASELKVESRASSGNKKRKGKGNDGDDGDNEVPEEDPHTTNKQGKEVKKGGRKKRKTSNEDENAEDDKSDADADAHATGTSDSGEGKDGRADKRPKQASNTKKKRKSAAPSPRRSTRSRSKQEE